MGENGPDLAAWKNALKRKNLPEKWEGSGLSIGSVS
jgi:hypothetical protein